MFIRERQKAIEEAKVKNKLNHYDAQRKMMYRRGTKPGAREMFAIRTRMMQQAE